MPTLPGTRGAARAEGDNGMKAIGGATGRPMAGNTGAIKAGTGHPMAGNTGAIKAGTGHPMAGNTGAIKAETGHPRAGNIGATGGGGASVMERPSGTVDDIPATVKAGADTTIPGNATMPRGIVIIENTPTGAITGVTREDLCGYGPASAPFS
jgi:hypothetical protein